MEARAGRTGRTLRLAKYDVRGEIGHGGMATVYLAHDPRLGRDVALKVIHPHLRDAPQVAQRFVAEAKAVAKLRHPNIVEVFDVSDEAEEEQYLVVELVRGDTLRMLLQKHGALPAEVAAAIALELLSALAHAHEAGVVHRDIKPENVMIEHAPGVSKDGRPRVAVKLMDFGIAKLLDAQGVTSTGQVLGSPAHMAPEQIEGGEVDARADIFGLGVLFYECVVGHLPFEGNNPAQVLRRVLDGQYAPAEAERGTVGKPWSVILDHALAHDTDARFADAGAMRVAVEAELERLGIASARAELESFLDDPEAYAKAHDRRMIEVLCARAGEARKRGDVLSAAADYNRALAYAPHDPALLKIIASIERGAARVRMLKRVARAAAVMLLLGVVAFFVTQAIKPKISADLRPIASTPSPLASTAPTAFDSAAPSPSVRADASTPAPSAISTSRIPIIASSLPHALPTAIGRDVRRDLLLKASFPQFGLLASLDGAAFVPVSSSITFNVDTRAHTLALKCIDDLCVEQTRSVPAGEDPAEVDVRMTVRPAKLVVQGDANATYQIMQRPNVNVIVGQPVTVAMSEIRARFTVKQLPSEKTVTVQLEAGKTGTASFSE